MANLFDYLDWRGDLTFEESEINKIDILLLSHLTYSIFDDLVSPSFNEEKTFAQVVKEFKLLPDFEKRSNIGFLINKQTVNLMYKCIKTRRFKNVKMCGYKVIFDEENDEQFGAITYIAGNRKIICFKGTDDSFTGWKEDFNLSFMQQIPSQKNAIEYFKAAADFFDGDFILSGHSKGGNLAVYTAVNSGKLQKRINSVYNYDGPGFSKDFFEQPEYKAVENKIYSFYPYFSVVGMLFNHPAKFEIVNSDGFTFWQHDSLTWQIMGKNFENKKDFNEKSQFFNKAFNIWIEELTIEQRKQFVNALFRLMFASGYKNINDLESNVLPASAKMISSYAGMDRIEKKQIHEIISLFREVLHTDFTIFKFLG